MPGKVNKLFKWCKKVTEPYDSVDLVNMTTSWKSGLAFCAIIHQFRPDLIDFDALSEDDPYRNNKIAFHTAEKELGIPALLDAEDLIKMSVPDRFSIATYVAQFYDKFKDLPEIGRPKRSRINASDATVSQTSGLSAKNEDLQTNISMSVNNDIPTNNTAGVMDADDLTLEVTYSKDTSDHTEDNNLEKSHALLDQGRCNEQDTIPSVPDRVNNNPHIEVHASRDAAQIFDLNNTLSDLAEKKEYIFFPDSRCLEFPENSIHVAKNIKTDLGECSYQAHGGHIRVDAGSVEEDKGVGWSSDHKQNVDSRQNYIDEFSHPQCSNYERNVECINVSLIDSNSELHVLTMDKFSGSLIKDIDSNTFAQGVDNDGGEVVDRSRDDENMGEISDDANNKTEKVVEERDIENAGNWGIQNNILEDSGSDSTLTRKVLNTSTHQNHYSGDFGNYGDNFLGITKPEKVDLENRVEGKGDNIDEDDPKRKTTFLEMKLSDLVTENTDNSKKMYGFENEQSNSIGVALVGMIGEYPDIINESEEKKENCSLQIEVESERKISVLEMTIMDSMTETINNKDKISQLEKTESDPARTSSSLVSVIANTTQATDTTQTGASVEVILPLDDVSCHIAKVQTVVTGSISHETGHGRKSESQVILTLHDRFDDIPKDEASDVISIDEVSDNLQNNANDIEIPPVQTEACVRHICEMASNSDSGATSIPTSSCELKSCGENVFELSGKSENVGEDIVESILISNHEKTYEMNMCEKADNFHGQDNNGVDVVDNMSTSETVDQSDIHAISLLAEENIASIIMQTVAGSVDLLTEEKGAGKEHNGTNETPDERMERIFAHGLSSDPTPSEDDSDLELKQNAETIDTIILKTVFMDIESVDKDDNDIILDPRDISSQNSEHLNGSIGTEMTNIDDVAKSLENYADSIVQDCDHVDVGSTTETQAAGEACSVATEIILTTDYNVHVSDEGTHVPEFSHQVEAADVIMSHDDNFDFNGKVFVDHSIRTMPLSSDKENSQYQGENTERKRTSLMVKLSYGGQSEDNCIQDRKDSAIDGLVGSECKYMVRHENEAELESSPVVNIKEVEIKPESHITYEGEKIDCKILLEDRCSHLQYQQNSNLHEDIPLPSIRSIDVPQLVMHDSSNHASGEEDLFDKSSFEQNIELVLEQSCQGLELQSNNQVDKAAYSSGPAVFSSCLEAKEILTSAVTKQNKLSLNYVGRNEEDKNTAVEMQDGNDGVLVSRDISEKNDAIMFCGFENSAVNSRYGSEVGSTCEMSDQGDNRFETEEVGDDMGAFSKKRGETEFAELDLDIIKKAAIMAQQMAARLSSEKKAKQEEEENMKNSDVKEEKESKEEKGSKDYHAGKIEEGTDEKTDPKANSSLEETVEKHKEEEKLDKPKISASVSRIQYWTRPTRFDSQAADRFEEDSLDNSYSQDFKRKMKLFSRAECNNGEPPQTNSDYAQRSGRVSDIFKRKLTKSTSFPTSSHSSDSSAISGTISCTSCKGNVKSVLQQLENQGNERGYIHRPFEVIKTEGLMEDVVYDETKQWPMKMVSNKEPREIKLTVQPVSAKFEIEEEVSENQVESILRTRESLTKTPDKTPRKVCVDIHPVMEQLQKGRDNENDSELVLSDKRLVRKQDSISDGVPSKLDIVIQPVTAKLDHSYPGKELPKANMLSKDSNNVLRGAVSGVSHETGNTPQKHSIALHPVVAKPWSPPVTQTRTLVMPNVIFSKKNSTSLVHPKAELLNPVKVPPLPVSAKAIHEKMVLPSDQVSSEMVSSEDLLRRNSSETKSPPPFIVSVRPFSAKVELEKGAKATEKTVEATKEKMFKTGFISPNSVRLSLYSTDNMVTSDVTDQNNSLSSPSDMTQSNQRNVVSSGQGWFKRRNKSTSGFDKPGNISHVQSCLQKQIHKTGLEDTSEERKTCLLKSSSYSEADQSDSRPDDSRQAKLLRKTLSDAPKYTVREMVVKTATSNVLKSTKSIYETIKAYQGKDSELELKSKCSVTEPKRFSQDTASSLDSPSHEKGKSLTHVSTGRDSYSVHHGDQRMDSDQNGCQEEILKNQIQTVHVLLPDIQKNHDAIPPSHVISTVPEIVSKDEESSPTSEGLHEELQPSRSYERPAVNGKAMERGDFSIEALESETVIYKNGNVIVSEEIHSEKEVTELGASQIEMKTGIMATEIGTDTDQKAVNVGMEIEQKAVNNVMETEQMATNNVMEIEQMAANIVMEIEQKAVNIVMETEQMATNIGMEIEQKAVNNVMETEQMATNNVMEIEQMATNIVMEIEQKAVNIVMETEQMATNIGMEIEQNSVNIVMEIEQIATNNGMETDQKVANIEMETDQKAENVGMEIEQKVANIGMEIEQKAANIEMETDQMAANIEMETDQKAVNIGIETDQKVANIEMENDQKAANIEMETYQKVANNGMEMDQKAADNEIETDQNTANIVMKTDQKAADIEMEAYQKVINIETDQKVAYVGMETDQKVANIGMGTSDMVTEIKLKIENDVFRKYLQIEENASVVITGFKKDEGGLLYSSGSSDEATDLSRTVSKLEPHSINEKSGLHVESSLGLVTDESISEQEVATTVSPMHSFVCGEVIDSKTKKHCEETQIEVKAFSQFETGLVIDNEFNEEKFFLLDEGLCSDKIKLDEVKTCSMKPDDALDGEIGVSKSHGSDLDHSGEESVFKEETIQPVYIETENTLPCSEFLIWRETKDSRTDEETSDFEDKKFVIGREKDPSKSEVARLIQQSLDLDRRREEMRIRDQEQMQALHDHFKPRDEVLEHEHLRRMSEGSERMEKEDTLDDDDSDDEEEADEGEESQRDEGEEELVEEVVEEVSVSEEYNAGEATPMSMPSGIDTDNSVSSPEENGKVAIEVFDLQDSSSESVSPDMEAQALFIKLKEVQTKNSVLEAELAKLKARIIMLEKEESHRKQYEKKCEDMAMRLRDVEKSLENAMREKNHYQDMLEGSQGQYIGLEKKMKGSYTALEKKYHKAKKLIKDYQLREKDFIQERESLLQQQIEKDQQYNALVKSLKDRIIQLEGDLNETPAAAGLPGSILPSINGQKVDTSVITKASTTAVSSTPKVFLSSPIRSLSGADTESISSGSEASSLEPVTSPDLDDESKKLEVSLKDKMELESVPQTTLLDTSASRSKGQLATAGGLAARRPPTKKIKSSDSSESEKSESHDHVENRAAESESGLETWIKHDSDSTVRKNDTKKRKAAQPSPGKESSQDFPSYPDSPPPPPPPTQPPPLLLEGDTASEKSQSRTDEEGSEETLSQTSYDPTNPNFKGLDSEIPDSVSIDTTDTLETQGSGSSGTASSGTGNKKSSGKSISLPKLPFKFATSGSKDKGNGGIVLLSNKSLEASNDAPRSEGGITLISKKALNTGYDFDGASVNSDASSGYMVSEPDVVSKGSSFSLNISGTPAVQESPTSQNRQNQFQSCAIAEWNIEHVRHWLMGLEMEKYSSLFTEKNITGSQLLLLDGNRLKTLGISDSKDRELLKKKIKEIKATAEKERKQQEKEKKLQEKEQKLKEKEQKKQKKK